MQYVVITITPEIAGISLVVFDPFETQDEAEEFLEGWIDAHPGTHGIVRPLTRPLDRLWGFFGTPSTVRAALTCCSSMTKWPLPSTLS
jgi:hypothetical protein